MLKHLTLAIALLALLVSPVIALAQDDDEDMDMEWVEFESELGVVTISHPAEWFVSDSGDPEDPTSITFANNEDLLERILNDDDEDDAAVEGDKGGVVIGFPAEILAFLGVEITEESTPDEAVASLSEVFFSEDAEADVELGEPELVEVEDQPAVGIVPFTENEDSLEGVIYFYTKEGFAIFGFVAANAGEFDEEFQDVALETVLSYEFTITAEELLAQMMGQ